MRLRVGVIGTGLIAQVMHLHYLRELDELFGIAAVCDIVGENAAACARQYGIGGVFTDWRDLLAEPLDAVLILTSGDHAPIAMEAARAGLHVFVEKPMCYSAADGAEMTRVAAEAGVTLMVGYPKRYDPGYARFREEAGRVADARLLRVTTLESPIPPYTGHYPLLGSAPTPAGAARRLRAESAAAVAAAIGPGASDSERRIYSGILLDTLVHEINAVRGLLGDPDRIDYADLSERAVTVMLRFGELPVAIHWIDLPGIAGYQMEFALFAPDRRVRLVFPSPFLRNEPSQLTTESGEPGGARAWLRAETVSYESGFRRELAEFHRCVTSGDEPATSGRDTVADIAICRAIIECHRTGRPVPDPAGSR